MDSATDGQDPHAGGLEEDPSLRSKRDESGEKGRRAARTTGARTR